MQKKIIVLTGAGISAESGIRTFRDSNGLWENHRIEDVASPEGFNRNPDLVNDFYDARRKQAAECNPNEAHYALSFLEEKQSVHIITQNVDDLHQRAGSRNVLHLHGKLAEVRSTTNEKHIHNIGKAPIDRDFRFMDGGRWRPNIVWFGEDVPNIIPAVELAEQADIFLIIGTSLQVYPAASLMNYTKNNCLIIYLDPMASTNIGRNNRVHCIDKTAVEGIAEAIRMIV